MFARIVVGVVLALLMGCSTDASSPQATSPRSTSTPVQPSPSSTLRPVGTDIPPEAFIRLWFEWYQELQATGRSDAYLKVSRDCGACMSAARHYARIYADGGVIRGGVFDVKSIRRIGAAADVQTWLANVTSTPTRYRESRTSPVRRLDGGRVVFRFILRDEHQGVVVADLFQESL